jgi:hypothetical protein
MEKFYTGLIVIDKDQKEGLLCKGKAWQIYLQPNLSSNTLIGPNSEPANEIIVYAKSPDRAQYVSNLILASYCLYTSELLLSETLQVISDSQKETYIVPRSYVGVSNLPISCHIAAKASHRVIHQYAIFKYQLSSFSVPLGILELDPSGDWIPGKRVSDLPENHVLYSNSIVLSYSVIEELSLEIRASTNNPAFISGLWNPKVREDLITRLAMSKINLSEPVFWHLRDTPAMIERTRKPTTIRKTEWARFKVRDSYIEIPDAIAYASWLRSSVSSHRLSRLSRSLTIYDVANVQNLARRLLLEVLGFWRNQ